MPSFRGLTSKNLFSSASAVRRKKEKDCYLKNGSCVLEELLALCDGNCRIPIRYFTAIEIQNAIRHSKTTIMELADESMVTGSLDNRPVLIRFNTWECNNINRDIAVTAQMSHLKSVLRLVGCCLEFEQPVMVYEHVEGISLFSLLYKKFNRDDQTRKSLSWGNQLRVAREVASAIVFLHTEFTTPIIHRNIKPHNVIIDEKSGVAKILNFSLSISLPPGKIGVARRYCVGNNGLFTGKDVWDIITRVYSICSKERIDFEEDVKSNTEEGNSTDRLDSTNSKETTEFKNLPTNYSVDYYIKESNVMDIADPIILEEHGIEIQQQLEDYLDLVKKCTTLKGDDRPYMIHVARELGRIEKCFRALVLGQN